ncbi:hypothetical protein ACFRCW_42480 [Streptomyces sp. NPDC056653]|uniref:hypothetical protein n=1 Tax=Streptomyces sp. NPDC056653 TaxID=3345894 RepID=UPI00369A5150
MGKGKFGTSMTVEYVSRRRRATRRITCRFYSRVYSSQCPGRVKRSGYCAFHLNGTGSNPLEAGGA